MKALYLILFSFLLSSCEVDKIRTFESPVDVSYSQDGTNNELSDPFTIEKVDIEGINLLIDVAYGGGCEDHEWSLIWPEAIIAIYPPELGVQLNHNANGDLCEAYLRKTLTIDLTKINLGFSKDQISDLRITVINGSNPDNQESNF